MKFSTPIVNLVLTITFLYITASKSSNVVANTAKSPKSKKDKACNCHKQDKGEFVLKKYRGRNEDYKQKRMKNFYNTNSTFGASYIGEGGGSLTSGSAFPLEEVPLHPTGYFHWPDFYLDGITPNPDYNPHTTFKYSIDVVMTRNVPNYGSIDSVSRWDSQDNHVTFCQSIPIFGGCYYFRGGGDFMIELGDNGLPKDLNQIKYRSPAIGGSGILGRTIADRFGYIVATYNYSSTWNNTGNRFFQQSRDLDISYYEETVENINDLLDFGMNYPEFFPPEARVGDDMFNKDLPTIPPRGQERDQLILEYLSNH